MFGSYFGKKEIVELMVNHPVAKILYSEKKRRVIKKYGHLLFKLFGYPLSVSVRQNAKVVMKYLNPKKGEKILDAGCGIGCYSFELATKFGCRVDGIDMDTEDIELAKQIIEKRHVSNVEFNVCGIFELKFDDETFDKVILIDVLEHIANDVRALKELHRVLKPEGQLILSTPYVDIMEEYTEQKPKTYAIYKKERNMEGGHIRSGYSFERLSEILNDTGFDVVGYTYIVKKFTKEVDFPMFLLMYPLSMLDNLLKGTGEGIIVNAKRRF